MITLDFEKKTKELIDSLKNICANYGLGNDGNEFKIITQVFLYKFLNDKFAYEVKQLEPSIAAAERWETKLSELSDTDYGMLLRKLDPSTAKLKPHHFISTLYRRQDEADFAKTFDDTLNDIAINNADIFSVRTIGGAKVQLFDSLSEFISDPSRRDAFCKAIINKQVFVSFEYMFEKTYDYFATIFEYLISDYNKDSGGKYAEYYTPHPVAKIMAAILVPEEQQGKLKNVTCCDPSAGSGTLLMNLAHVIGEDRCIIYTQDISQKSSSLLRLNLILNNLVHSINNVVQGNTILDPFHREGSSLMQFDYIVSNPPFKMDFSDFRDDLDTKTNNDRFFAGIPNIPKKAKDKMAIYLLFLQHIIYTLKPNGKAAVVVPTGFLTAQSGIDKKIRQKLVDEKMLGGVVSMPSNIFATTGTNVSILFIDKTNKDSVVLIDASGLGEKIKEGKNQKTVLSAKDEEQIISTFNDKSVVEDFSAIVSYDEIANRNYSFSAGQYFEVKIEYIDISEDEFNNKIQAHRKTLEKLFDDSQKLEEDIDKRLRKLSID